MPIDKTDKQLLEQLIQKYKDEIIEYEYKHWKESYLAPPPPRSYAQSMLRYRMCYKVEYIKLKDGSKIKVGGLFNGVNCSQNNDVDSENQIGCMIFFISIGLLIFILIII
jgi:hypothetical protein